MSAKSIIKSECGSYARSTLDRGTDRAHRYNLSRGGHPPRVVRMILAANREARQALLRGLVCVSWIALDAALGLGRPG